MSRPTLDAMLLDVAATVATRSTCSRLHVGAVIARDGRILSTGYNGAPANVEHCPDPHPAGPCAQSVHAEGNAIAFAARHGSPVDGAHLYLTHAPCAGCAGLIVNAGIAAVHYTAPYRDPAGRDRLVDAGIRVRQSGPTEVLTH